MMKATIVVTLSVSSGSGLKPSCPRAFCLCTINMCLVINLFQAASAQARWLISLFAITGIFSFVYWFILVPVLFDFLKNYQGSETWVEHWSVIYFAVASLLWCLLMFIIIGLWYLCRKRAFRNVEEPTKEALVTKEDYVKKREANEKVRQTLGLDEAETRQLHKILLQRRVSNELPKHGRNGEAKTTPVQERNNSKIKNRKTVEDLELVDTEITSLPEYSPLAKTTIFDFPQDNEEHPERERSRSPFREFLHLVQIEPTSPEITFEEECMKHFSGSFSSQEGQRDTAVKSPTDSTQNNGATLISQDAGDREVADLPQYKAESDSGDDDVFEREASRTLDDPDCSVDQQAKPDSTLRTASHGDQSSRAPEDSASSVGKALQEYEHKSPSERETEVPRWDTDYNSQLKAEKREESPSDLKQQQVSKEVENALVHPEHQEQESITNSEPQLQEAKEERKPPPKLVRKESAMFLGIIGKTKSVLSEMTLQITGEKDCQYDNGTVVATRKYQVIATSNN